jgi:putative membrane protein
MNDIRKPTAFVIEDEPKRERRKPRIEFDIEPEGQELVQVPEIPRPARRHMRWGLVLLSSLTGLITLWAGLAATQLIEDAFARAPALGWLALGIGALAGLAAVAIAFREIWGLMRLDRIEHIQESAARAMNADDAAAARQAIAQLESIYGGRPDLRWGLGEFRKHHHDVMDPRDRMALFDRLVIRPVDEEVHRIIARRARRVTLLTTVTPAAALDIVFVAAQNLMMLRELAELYGGKPSTISTLKLARMVVGHLAVTGGLALSDNLLQLVVGKGLLGRLSARFGEGAVNGIMTSRIGLAALDVCRPIPQPSSRKETLTSLLRELVTFGDKTETGDPKP